MATFLEDMQRRLHATQPLRYSPQEREAWARMESAAEDRRRFDASERRFRDAEAARHAEQAYTNETARMTAHGQYLNDKERDITEYKKNQWAASNSATAEENRHGEAAYRNETERADSEAKWAEAEAARKSQQDLLGPKPPPDGRRFIYGENGEVLYWDDAAGRYVPHPGAASPAGGPPAPGTDGGVDGFKRREV